MFMKEYSRIFARALLLGQSESGYGLTAIFLVSKPMSSQTEKFNFGNSCPNSAGDSSLQSS
jgi:hypothetical protein